MNRHLLPSISIALLAACWVGFAVSPAVAQSQTATSSLSDRVIGLAVENELLSSDAVAAHRIDASSQDGVVTLSGKVDNLLAKRRAAELAQQVKGVMAVVNQVVVVQDEQTDRGDLAQQVLRAWSEDDVTETMELRVDASAGELTISGEVDSHAEKDLAEQVAASVAGVTGIENKVEVAERTERRDEEIQEEVQRLLESAAALDDAELEAAVDDGRVVVTGRVGTAFARSIAERKARVAGVQSVDVRGVRIDPELYDGTRRRKRMEEVTDEQIVETVRLAMRQDPRVLSYLEGIEVESEGGAVTLSGRVGRLRAKRAAEQVARSTVGVWRVKNSLKVRWEDEEPTAHEIIDHVQAALDRDPYVSRHEIRVHCRNAHVSLYGLVDSEFEKRAAGWIAGSQKGVVHVNNSLSVAKEWKPKSDAEIKADLEEKLQYTFFDKSNDIDVTVENGVAILRGEVDTWRAWQAALDKAIAAGSRQPHNLLKVRYHPTHGGSRIYVPR